MITIYLLGMALAAIICFIITYFIDKRLRTGDLMLYIIISSFSWIGIVILFAMMLTYIMCATDFGSVLWVRKEKPKK